MAESVERHAVEKYIPLWCGIAFPVATFLNVQAVTVPGWLKSPLDNDIHNVIYKRRPQDQVYIQPWPVILISLLSLTGGLIGCASLFVRMLEKKIKTASRLFIFGAFLQGSISTALCIVFLIVTLSTNIKHDYSEGFFYSLICALTSISVACLATFQQYLHRRQNYIYLDSNITPSQRQLIMLTISSLSYILGVGFIYSSMENWDFDDSLYFVVCTVTTIGFGDITPKTFMGKALTPALSTVGIFLIGSQIYTIRNVLLELVTFQLASQFSKSLGVKERERFSDLEMPSLDHRTSNQPSSNSSDNLRVSKNLLVNNNDRKEHISFTGAYLVNFFKNVIFVGCSPLCSPMIVPQCNNDYFERNTTNWNLEALDLANLHVTKGNYFKAHLKNGCGENLTSPQSAVPYLNLPKSILPHSEFYMDTKINGNNQLNTLTLTRNDALPQLRILSNNIENFNQKNFVIEYLSSMVAERAMNQWIVECEKIEKRVDRYEKKAKLKKIFGKNIRNKFENLKEAFAYSEKNEANDFSRVKNFINQQQQNYISPRSEFNLESMTHCNSLSVPQIHSETIYHQNFGISNPELSNLPKAEGVEIIYPLSLPSRNFFESSHSINLNFNNVVDHDSDEDSECNSDNVEIHRCKSSEDEVASSCEASSSNSRISKTKNNRKHRHVSKKQEIVRAYDQHMNLVLSDAEEIITQVEVNPETYEEMIRTVKKNYEMLFVRGDGVILVSPPTR
ncbi:Potassium channel [Clydaea vesicula]|uniref:Potassium channel n=1 Tax=Clydaea vesicula TaxID=447962 RepID=A0AAD5Y0K2_9FUNG|nr:Potassium channel [Clydaea vesicula]